MAVREEFPEATIIRPSSMYGEDDHFFTYWSHYWRRGYSTVHMWNKGFGIYKAPVFVSDVAEGIVNAIFDNASLGKTYEALGQVKYWI